MRSPPPAPPSLLISSPTTVMIMSFARNPRVEGRLVKENTWSRTWGPPTQFNLWIFVKTNKIRTTKWRRRCTIPWTHVSGVRIDLDPVIARQNDFSDLFFFFFFHFHDSFSVRRCVSNRSSHFCFFGKRIVKTCRVFKVVSPPDVRIKNYFICDSSRTRWSHITN